MHRSQFAYMLLLTFMIVSFQNCTPSLHINNNSSDESALLISTGAKLYTSHCASCHGDLGATTKRGRPAAAIGLAIANIGVMQKLSFLKSDEVTAIADVLRHEQPIVTPIPPISNVCTPASLSPRRVWMLSRIEFDRSVESVLGIKSVVAQTTFPPESRSNGFISNANGMVVGSNNITMIMEAAESIAAFTATQVVAGMGCTFSTAPASTTMDPCVANFVSKYAKAFFRRPVTTGEITDLYGVYLLGFQNPYESVPAATSGVRLLLTALIQSPQFLYRTELGAAGDTSAEPTLTSHELASSLSYLATGGPPDSTLMQHADSGQLSSPPILDAQIRRLIASTSGRDQLSQFFLELLGADNIASLGSATGPLTASLANAMKTETKKYVEHVIFNSSGNLSEILSSNYTIANQELASHYGFASSSATASFSRINVDPAKYGGILSQGSWLASTAHRGSPILNRGKIIREKMFCESLPTLDSLGLAGFTPPPLGAPMAGETTRQLLERAIPKGTNCFGCHQYFNPLGYALDNFDTFGRYRLTENGVTVDSSGEIASSKVVDPASGIILAPYEINSTSFGGYQGLMTDLATRKEVHACFTKHVMTFGTGRSDLMNNDCGVNALQAQFSETGLNLVEGFVKFALSPHFLRRKR